MKGSHSGNGTVKSEARKARLKSYASSGRRESNRDRRMARIVRGFRGRYEVVLADGIWHFRAVRP